jgi:hypothetical protein
LLTWELAGPLDAWHWLKKNKKGMDFFFFNKKGMDFFFKLNIYVWKMTSYRKCFSTGLANASLHPIVTSR